VSAPPAERLRLDPLEVAAVRCPGVDPEVPALPTPPPGQTPVAALEAALLPALERPPCLVAFSGGRDSSALLAVATRLACREGLPAPVPATLRVPAAPRAEESEWQELVLGHLGLDDWLRIELDGELDFVGPTAQKVLRRHGLLWPANLHFFAPVVEAAAGGTLVTGVGGDAVFASGGPDLLGQSRLRAAPRRAARRVYHRLPAAARRPYAERRLRREAPWLRPAAAEAMAARWLALPPEPRAVDARLDHIARQRPLVLTLNGLDLLAADEGMRIVSPLLDLGFLASLGRFLGRRGVGGRTTLMRALFSEVLPEKVLTRDTKATFGEAFCGPYTRALAAGWDGAGLDPELVDPDALRKFWGDCSELRPLGLTALLCHAIWLAGEDRPQAESTGTVPTTTRPTGDSDGRRQDDGDGTARAGEG
jgi:asparagine synthase (glutamine-hydrolysing)